MNPIACLYPRNRDREGCVEQRKYSTWFQITKENLELNTAMGVFPFEEYVFLSQGAFVTGRQLSLPHIFGRVGGKEDRSDFAGLNFSFF